jgi:peptidoglycan/LPS O-acetylase OafA/YrhL
MVFVRPPIRGGLDVTVLAVAAALVIQFERDAPAALRWFGRNSYEVYLTHMFVVTLGTQWFTSHHVPISLAPLWFAGTVAAAGLLGFAVARWYSEPLNRRLRGKPLLSATVSV